MSTLGNFAVVDPNTGLLDPSIIPAGSGSGGGGGGGTGGGPQVWEWHFPGTLQPRVGLVKRLVPLTPLTGGAYKIRPLMLTATLGTLSSVDARTPAVSLRLLVNAAERHVLTFQQNDTAFAWAGASSLPALSLTPLEPTDVVSVDILVAPSSGTVRPADLTVQLWWEWHAV